MTREPKELAPDTIEWIEEPATEAAVEKAAAGDLPQLYEEGGRGSDHQDEGWRAERLAKP